MLRGIGSPKLPTVGAAPCAFKDPQTARRRVNPDKVTEWQWTALVCASLLQAVCVTQLGAALARASFLTSCGHQRTWAPPSLRLCFGQMCHPHRKLCPPALVPHLSSSLSSSPRILLERWGKAARRAPVPVGAACPAQSSLVEPWDCFG